MKPIIARAVGTMFVFLALVMACLPSSGQPISSPTPTPPTWILNWLENPMCSLPCWQGIRPGITNANDALSLQGQYPDMSIEKERGTSTVQMIELHFSLYDTLPINTIMSKYGEPKYVRIFKCDPNRRCEVHVIYDDLGMVLNLYPDDVGKDYNHAVVITANTNILDIFFMEIGIDQYFGIDGFNGTIDNDLMRWEGFKQYP